VAHGTSIHTLYVNTSNSTTSTDHSGMAECSNLLNQEVLQQTDTLHPTSSCYCRNKDPSDSLAKLLPVVAAVVTQPTTTEAYLGQQ